MRSATEWAKVRALAADGVWQREIAGRLGINRRTVKRLRGADEPPRAHHGSQHGSSVIDSATEVADEAGMTASFGRS